MSKRSRFLGVVVPVVALVLAAVTARSLPRLAAAYGTDCASCHINPTGGGMRNAFGHYSVALNELTLPQTKSFALERHKMPRLGEAMSFGFDSRYLVLDDGDIFRMQTDLYVNITPFDNFSYNIRYSDNILESGIGENYALLTLGDNQHYIKAGRFYPAFGLRQVDHTAHNRERTGHPPVLYLDGLSVGVDVYGTLMTGEVFERDGRHIYGLHLYHPGFISDIGYFMGGSLRLSEEIEQSNGAFPHARALFAGISYDRLSLLGEVDLAGKSNDTLVFYSQLTGRLEYGLHAIAEYNFFDGDRDRKTGTDEFLRFSLEIFPISFVELRPSYTVYTEGSHKDDDEFFVQFHVGY